MPWVGRQRRRGEWRSAAQLARAIGTSLCGSVRWGIGVGDHKQVERRQRRPVRSDPCGDGSSRVVTRDRGLGTAVEPFFWGGGPGWKRVGRDVGSSAGSCGGRSHTLGDGDRSGEGGELRG